MKKIIFILFICVHTIIIYGQEMTNENSNFIIENNEVTWIKIYDTELSKEKIIDNIKSSGKFDNIVISENKLTAIANQLSIDYASSGENIMSIPMYLSSSNLKCFIIIDFKENKYRSTIKNIKFIQKYDDALSKANEITDIELYALSKNNTVFKNGFMKKPLKILDYTFSKLTNFNNTNSTNNW